MCLNVTQPSAHGGYMYVKATETDAWIIYSHQSVGALPIRSYLYCVVL